MPARQYLVTGGAGFIGSNFIRYVLTHESEARVTNLDSLASAGVEATVAELDADARHRFVRGSITDRKLVEDLMPGHDVVVNFAAESHVDRSIVGPLPFIETNVLGTAVLLDAARHHEVPRFVQVSTDEVYGSIATGFPSEQAALQPSSPYSAAKAGADLLVHSYWITYGYPALGTRCTNNFGPYQFPEKVIPLCVTNLLDGRKAPLYGDGKHERDWLYVEDYCAALHLLVDRGESGGVYNIGADNQMANIDLLRRILAHLGKDESWIEHVADRPGHDLRYAVDSSRMRALGWAPRHDFDERLEDTIVWYRQHEDWWRPLQGRHK